MENKRTYQILAAGGIVFIVLQILAHGIFIQAGGMEPPFDASADDIVKFFETRKDPLFFLGGNISIISFIVFMGFLASLYHTLKSAEGAPGILALTALGSGVIWAAILAGGHAYWAMAYFRLNNGLTPELAQILFDLGNFTFAISWVFMAGFILFTGIISLKTLVFSRWFSWFSVITAILFLLAIFIWTSPLAFLPYVLTYVWFILTSIKLIKKAGEY
jgi:hypothetical protein